MYIFLIRYLNLIYMGYYLKEGLCIWNCFFGILRFDFYLDKKNFSYYCIIWMKVFINLCFKKKIIIKDNVICGIRYML